MPPDVLVHHGSHFEIKSLFYLSVTEGKICRGPFGTMCSELTVTNRLEKPEGQASVAVCFEITATGGGREPTAMLLAKKASTRLCWQTRGRVQRVTVGKSWTMCAGLSGRIYSGSRFPSVQLSFVLSLFGTVVISLLPELPARLGLVLFL